MVVPSREDFNAAGSERRKTNSSFRFAGANLQHQEMQYSSMKMKENGMKKLFIFFVLTFALAALGWSEDMHMKNVSTNQPAADAQLTHQKDDNGNVKVK